MDRFHQRQHFERNAGPGLGAPSDGLTPGTPYTAVIRSAVSGSLVTVTIPALHLTLAHQAKIGEGLTPEIGDSCLVIFDEQKIPWVISYMKP